MQINRIRSQGAGTSRRSEKDMAVNIQSVGVIGAGQMGNGIAHVCALAGYSVLLNDVSPDRIKARLATVKGNLARQVGSGKIAEAERAAAFGRISAAESYDGLADADLIIEAAVEDETIKREILRNLSKV